MEVRQTRVRPRFMRSPSMKYAVMIVCVFCCLVASGQKNSQCMICLKHCSAEWDSIGGLILCKACLDRNNCKPSDLSLFFFDYHCIPSPVTERVKLSWANMLTTAQKSRFMNSTMARAVSLNLTRAQEEGRTPVVKSYLGQLQNIGKREVCPTNIKFHNPRTAEHVSSGLIVHLFAYPGMTQYYFLGECRYNRPIFVKMNPPGKCKTVKLHHRALFTVDERKMQIIGRDHCHLMDSVGRYYLCDDWVKLNTTCSLFI